MRIFQYLILCLFILITSVSAHAQSAPPKDPEQYKAWAAGMWSSIERKQGEVRLPNGVATLQVPEQFYYLNPADAERVLTEVWGNPPGAKVLGMLFPTGTTPFDANAWGVTIDYEEDGYVADKDATEIDYSDLLKDMQGDVSAANEQRQKQGFEPITLIGWAATPHYDKSSHKLYWAKELQFGKDAQRILNYNIRMLGRKGVLVLNFIADMSQKPAVESNLDRVLAMANFDQGHRYDEFNPSLDKVAAYGIGGLIAGKVIAKTGFLLGALLFLKKFAIVGIAALVGLVRKLFKSKA